MKNTRERKQELNKKEINKGFSLETLFIFLKHYVNS